MNDLQNGFLRPLVLNKGTSCHQPYLCFSANGLAKEIKQLGKGIYGNIMINIQLYDDYTILLSESEDLQTMLTYVCGVTNGDCVLIKRKHK